MPGSTTSDRSNVLICRPRNENERTKPAERRFKCFSISCPKRKRIRYVQPPIPQSYAPIRVYQKPQTLVENDTIYKLSYQKPSNSVLRALPILQNNNLHRSPAKMSIDTVHKLSYLPNQIKDRTTPIYPRFNKLFGSGPMQDLTTNKHDYVPKPFYMRGLIKPIKNICNSKEPLDGKTTYCLSYQTTGVIPLRQPFTPKIIYKAPSIQMDCATINKLSYLPNPVLAKWTPPWAIKPAYSKPCEPIESDTIYKNSYAPPGWECFESDDGNSCGSIANNDCDCLSTFNDNEQMRAASFENQSVAP